MQLNDYVPFFVSKIKEIQEVYKAQGKELDKINLDIRDLIKQCFVSTATWGLDFWEEFLGVTIEHSKNIRERRSNIFAKIRGQGTTTLEVIKQIAQAYADKADVIEDNSNYAFYINLISYKGYPFSLDTLYNNIEEIKPAHLSVKYKLLSITKSEFCIGAATLCGEKIIVYPLNIRKIESKGKANIAMVSNIGIENMAVYPWISKQIKSKGKINMVIGNNTGVENMTAYPRKER